ncbi:MAG: patatin-like phospholipase family protein [Candidatus Omnitrophota bacterium]|nr:patatin-like phospholipase family protein [Candidatus Omnitrophota bacterium]
MFPFKQKPKKITLVLGGGAARAIAHIGVLEVLDREKIPIDLIVATSMGSAIGAAYSLDLNLKRVEKMALGISFRDLIDVIIPRIAINQGKKLAETISRLTQNKGFEDLNIPLAVVATDISNGQTVVYRSGNLSQAITASCSIPVVYRPIKIDDRFIVDGGIKNTVPVAVARQLGAKFIIASDVGFCIKKALPGNIFQMMMQTYQIQGQELSNYQSMDAEVVIKPKLGEIDQMAFDRAAECIEKGREAGEAALKKLKNFLPPGPR